MLTVTSFGLICPLTTLEVPMRRFSVGIFSTLSVALAATTAGCAMLAIATAPAKKAAPDRSPAAKQADGLFWATLHGGRYDQIGPALDKLEGAYLEHPDDPRTAAHIGFLHIWRVSERARHDDIPPTITDDIALARRYF